MIVALIGMSGVGKSHHSLALGQRGFVHHDIDAAIAERIPDLVTPLPGERPVETVGRWMGMPWMPGREEREGRYLALEAEISQAAIEACTAGDHVLDTTGSVVYLPVPVLELLRSRARIVYLERPQHDSEAMLGRYLAQPKPVIWGASWDPRPEESQAAALARCYPQLLAWRDERYRALAHMTVRAEGLVIDSLLSSATA